MPKLSHYSFNIFSPPITLFYNEKKKHSRLSSFILSIISILIIVFFTIYFFIKMVTRQKFTAYVYDSFAKTAPEIKADKTGFFHYYTFDGIEPNDKYITVVGYDSKNIYEYIYGKCTEQNLDGLENLIIDKENFLTYGYCIQKSVKISDGSITLATDKNFVWPVIAENGNFCYYFEVKKCSNTSNLFNGETKECASQEEINKYIENEYGATIYVLNNYVDIGALKNPITTYFYALDIQIRSQTYSVYHVNYDLGVINSHQNLFTGEITKTNTIVFSRLDTASGEKIEGKTDLTIAMIYFWRSSKKRVYERKYEGFLDFLTDIGGIYQIIIRTGSLINACFSGYAELIDSIILYNDVKKNIKKNPKTKAKMNIICRYQSMNLSNYNNGNKIVSKNERRENSKNELIISNSKREIKSIDINKINKIENIDINDKHIGFFKYLYFLISECFHYKKDIFKYLDIRKKILSEEFLYQLYFEKYIENFRFINGNESKENFILPNVENMRNFDIFQKTQFNN